jgi:hypothetical protein
MVYNLYLKSKAEPFTENVLICKTSLQNCTGSEVVQTAYRTPHFNHLN